MSNGEETAAQAPMPVPTRRFNYVGEPVSFAGYVDDLEHGVAAVQLSLDDGENWTDYPVAGSRSNAGLSWDFTYVPKVAGHYRLKARALSRSGRPAATVETFPFDVLPERDRAGSTWGSAAVRPVGPKSLEDGRLFRSRELCGIGPEEALTLVNVLGIRSVYDIRGAKEIVARPNPDLPGVRMLAVEPLDAKRASDARNRLVAGVIGEYGAPEERMLANYRRYAADYPLIGCVLRSVASSRGGALVHCKNGKDRTGVLCATAMLVAGYSYEETMDDYLLTNLVNASAIEAEAAELGAGMTPGEREVLMSFLEARPAYLDAFLDEAAARHGSFEGYVRHGLGLTEGQCARIAELLR